MGSGIVTLGMSFASQESSNNKKAEIMKIKEYLGEEFDRWEMVVYFILLPLGFILSGVFGYLCGTI